MDGIRDERLYHGSCTHTRKRPFPHWWMVYFGRTALVFRVYVTNFYQHYYPTLDIRIGNIYRYNANPFCKRSITHDGPGTRNFACDAPMKGKYLFIVSNLKTVLSLCEVESTRKYQLAIRSHATNGGVNCKVYLGGLLESFLP